MEVRDPAATAKARQRGLSVLARRRAEEERMEAEKAAKRPRGLVAAANNCGPVPIKSSIKQATCSACMDHWCVACASMFSQPGLLRSSAQRRGVARPRPGHRFPVSLIYAFEAGEFVRLGR